MSIWIQVDHRDAPTTRALNIDKVPLKRSASNTSQRFPRCRYVQVGIDVDLQSAVRLLPGVRLALLVKCPRLLTNVLFHRPQEAEDGLRRQTDTIYHKGFGVESGMI